MVELCQVCDQKDAIYSCPRCSLKTCSAVCSKSHKVDKSCSGERDKTAYVPMNKYGWDTMTNDFTYLEDVGRKTTEWGKHILKNGLMSRPNNPKNKRFRGHIVGGKRESLRLQLEARGIYAEILPTGMEKSKLNKSSYDVKTKSILLTLEIIAHPPKSTTHEIPPIKILSHRHSLSSKVDSIVSKVLREYIVKMNDISPWLTQIAEQNEGKNLIFLMAQTSDTMPILNAKVFHKLAPHATLQDVLKSKTFVEYPTIEIWQYGDFTGILKEESGELSDIKPQARKRPRLDNKVESNAITSLLQDYTSQDDEEADKREGLLEMLGEYSTDNEPLINEDSNTEEKLDNDDDFSEEDIRAVLDAATDNKLEQLDGLSSDENDVDSWDDSEDEEVGVKEALGKVTDGNVAEKGILVN